mmetsp:Transcript_93915/g.223446  ORF Transcript_93915/g.223446 Transcript_93915/m.223446 type:complete len:375 (+) Transcript_93915:424-1548(+)
MFQILGQSKTQLVAQMSGRPRPEEAHILRPLQGILAAPFPKEFQHLLTDLPKLCLLLCSGFGGHLTHQVQDPLTDHAHDDAQQGEACQEEHYGVQPPEARADHHGFCDVRPGLHKNDADVGQPTKNHRAEELPLRLLLCLGESLAAKQGPSIGEDRNESHGIQDCDRGTCKALDEHAQGREELEDSNNAQDTQKTQAAYHIHQCCRNPAPCDVHAVHDSSKNPCKQQKHIEDAAGAHVASSQRAGAQHIFNCKCQEKTGITAKECNHPRHLQRLVLQLQADLHPQQKGLRSNQASAQQVCFIGEDPLICHHRSLDMLGVDGIQPKPPWRVSHVQKGGTLLLQALDGGRLPHLPARLRPPLRRFADLLQAPGWGH